MGYYALAGSEPDPKVRKIIQEYMVSDIQRRRDYIKAVTLSGCKLIFSTQIKTTIYIFLFSRGESTEPTSPSDARLYACVRGASVGP